MILATSFFIKVNGEKRSSHFLTCFKSCWKVNNESFNVSQNFGLILWNNPHPFHLSFSRKAPRVITKLIGKEETEFPQMLNVVNSKLNEKTFEFLRRMKVTKILWRIRRSHQYNALEMKDFKRRFPRTTHSDQTW